MSNIAINTSKLSIPEKLGKGQEIITMSTGNPKVPGNTALVTALSTAQAGLVAANAAFEQARQDCRQLMAARDAALVEWNAAINGLAAFTESATGGNATDILSSGFAVKAQPSPPQPVGQVLNVRVAFTGDPGYSEVSWKKESNADAYVVECSQEPITDTSWKNMGTVLCGQRRDPGAEVLIPRFGGESRRARPVERACAASGDVSSYEAPAAGAPVHAGAGVSVARAVWRLEVLSAQ